VDCPIEAEGGTARYGAATAAIVERASSRAQPATGLSLSRKPVATAASFTQLTLARPAIQIPSGHGVVLRSGRHQIHVRPAKRVKLSRRPLGLDVMQTLGDCPATAGPPSRGLRSRY